MNTIYTINKRLLLEQAFGLTGLSIYRLPSDDLQDGGAALPQTIQIPTDQDNDGSGLLGLPVYQNVVFPSGTYTDNGVEVSYPGMTLMDCIVDITSNKTIVSTPIAGRKGTVKELISIGDYTVTIKGLLVSESRNIAPQVLIKQIKSLFEVPAAIDVQAKIFEWVGIYKLALESLSLPKLQGVVNAQPFEISAISDLPVELVLNEEQDV